MMHPAFRSLLYLLVGLLVPLYLPSGASAQSQAGLERLKDNPFGSLYVTLRPRFEVADEAGRERSSALTLRSVIGFGTRTVRGLSLLIEGESVANLTPEQTFDGVSRPNGRTLIPDPDGVELNQLYVDYRNDALDSRVRLGRQQLRIDDERFIGTGSARQNEMTMDAATLQTTLGLPDVTLRYAYVDDVHRAFGDRGGPAMRDFDSRSHLVWLEYARSRRARVSVFSYSLDLDNAPSQSSRSTGLRLVGQQRLTPHSRLDWVLSHVVQTDAGDAPLSYRSSYQLVRATLRDERIGALTLGFERLGSDDGAAGFSTPLATLHAFNGLADAFLDNGGPGGLRDAFVEVAPELLAPLHASIAVHGFASDAEAQVLGWEVDLTLRRPVSRWVTLELSGGYFHGRTPERPSRLCGWLQASLHF